MQSKRPTHVPVAASTRSPAEKQLSGTVLLLCAVPRGTVWRSRAAREAARATPQLAAAPVPPVAGEQRPQAAGCKAADLQKRVGLISPTQPHKVVMSSLKLWDEERICRRGPDPSARSRFPTAAPAGGYTSGAPIHLH